MVQFGQIVDRFNSKGQSWITVWDLQDERKWSIPLIDDVDFRLGDLVDYTKDLSGDLLHIRRIMHDGLPPDLVPLIATPVTMGLDEAIEIDLPASAAG